MKVVILLIEGLMEEIVYLTILEKLYKVVSCKHEELPDVLRELIGLTKKSTKCYRLDQDAFICVINCGGFSQVKSVLKELFNPGQLEAILNETLKASGRLDLYVVIAADKDCKPTESIRNVLCSLGWNVSGSKVLQAISARGTKLRIYIIEQGGSRSSATGEIEDLLSSLIETLKPEFQEVIREIERIRNTKLTDKQRFLIYLALLEDKPKIGNLYKLPERILKQMSEDQVRKILWDLVAVLEEVLRY